MHAERAGEGGREDSEEGRRQLKKRTYLVLQEEWGGEGGSTPVAAGQERGRRRNELMESVDYCDSAINICPTASDHVR